MEILDKIFYIVYHVNGNHYQQERIYIMPKRWGEGLQK